MKHNYLFIFIILFLVGCQSEPGTDHRLVHEDDVLLVLVDGEPITLPMLELTMEARGISEDDHEGMRQTLDELIRLQTVANAARAAGMADEASVRARLMIRELEALQMRYFEQVGRDYPVSDEQIEAAYQAQVERTGDQQYQIETVLFPSQPAVLDAMANIETGQASFDDLIASATASGLTVDRPVWVDLTQLPPDIRVLMSGASTGDVLSLPLQTPQGWRIVRVSDQRAVDIPPLEQVRQGIVRSLARERLDIVVDELFQAAEITPMLPLEEAADAERVDGETGDD